MRGWLRSARRTPWSLSSQAASTQNKLFSSRKTVGWGAVSHQQEVVVGTLAVLAQLQKLPSKQESLWTTAFASPLQPNDIHSWDRLDFGSYFLTATYLLLFCTVVGVPWSSLRYNQ